MKKKVNYEGYKAGFEEGQQCTLGSLSVVLGKVGGNITEEGLAGLLRRFVFVSEMSMRDCLSSWEERVDEDGNFETDIEVPN